MPLSVSVTCPSLETARKLATAALEARLVACANIFPGVESHFWWEGKLSHETEVLLSFKTEEPHRGQLVSLIERLHPYDLPAITWTIQGALDPVIEWISAETALRG